MKTEKKEQETPSNDEATQVVVIPLLGRVNADEQKDDGDDYPPAA